MMKSPYFLTVFLTIAGLSGCIPEDKFGLSGFKEIKAFEIAGQAGATTINKADRTILIPFDDNIDVTMLAPSRIQLSHLASIHPGVGVMQDFSLPVIYTLTAEDGTEALWEVMVEKTGPTPKLSNSNLDLWYDAGGYQQPGESADNTIWDTANRGLTIVADPNTTPEDLGDGDFAAYLVSVKAPILVRMAAATLFTGTFTDGIPNASDPRSNVNFGTVFTARPTAFLVDYRYLPGEEYLDGDGNSLPGSDETDIYVLLEKREGENISRIGTGWFRSGQRVDEWTSLEVPIKYGELTAADPEFEYANIRDGESWGNPSDRPTHISVVFTSSALGDFFTGAIGSELWINNFQLVY